MSTEDGENYQHEKGQDLHRAKHQKQQSLQTTMVKLLNLKSTTWLQLTGAVMDLLLPLHMVNETIRLGVSTILLFLFGVSSEEIWTTTSLMSTSKLEFVWPHLLTILITPPYLQEDHWMVRSSSGMSSNKTLWSASLELMSITTESKSQICYGSRTEASPRCLHLTLLSQHLQMERLCCGQSDTTSHILWEVIYLVGKRRKN